MTTNIAILGGSGYTGYELLRLLALRDDVNITAVTSRQYTGEEVGSVFPSLARSYPSIIFSDPKSFTPAPGSCGSTGEGGETIVFSCLPHGASMNMVPKVLASGAKVIDLSADYRIKDLKTYEDWYVTHSSKELLSSAVYGLPELNREAIKSATLIANPGCYPTSAILGLAPLLKEKGVVKDSIVIDSKSGTSGAGRTVNLDTAFVEVTEGFKAYKVGGHRHTPEIEQELSGLAGEGVKVIFTPHLLPISRGILSTIHGKLTKAMKTEELQGLYSDHYSGEPFVSVLKAGDFPNVRDVRGSNMCHIGLWSDGVNFISVSVIDNLVKGASGQAIQNMNILLGLPEEYSLTSPSIGV